MLANVFLEPSGVGQGGLWDGREMSREKEGDQKNSGGEFPYRVPKQECRKGKKLVKSLLSLFLRQQIERLTGEIAI